MNRSVNDLEANKFLIHDEIFPNIEFGHSSILFQKNTLHFLMHLVMCSDYKF